MNSGPVILAYIIVVLVLVRFNPSAVTQITCAGLLYWSREDFMSKGTNNAIRILYTGQRNLRTIMLPETFCA